MINLAFLKTFVTVADAGSFKTAAEKASITQPAVSQHIQILEQTFKNKLFERRGKKATLTPAGKTLLPYAKNILLQFKEARLKVSDEKIPFNDTLKIATIYSIGLHELQPIARKFMIKYPQTHIHLEYHHNRTIYEMLVHREVDFGFVAYPEKQRQIESVVFSESRIVLVQSPKNRPITKKKISLSTLNKLKFIALSTQTPTRKIIDEFFHERQIKPKIIQEYENIETLKSAVAVGMGCALVPETTIKRELKDKTLEVIPVMGLTLKRPLGILYPGGKTLSEPAQAFLQLVIESGEPL